MTAVKDVKSWPHAGFDCLIREVGWGPGWLCGYVDLPREHALRGVDYDNIDAPVHGGLTYSKRVGQAWRLGFDCNHAGDTRSACNMDYVTAECEKLAQWLGGQS